MNNPDHPLQDKLIQDTDFIESAGFSMWPFIKTGEKLIVRRIPLENFKIGDIVLYRESNQIVCHRLVKKIQGESLFYVRGDNSPFSSEPVIAQMLLGKAIGVLRKGKIISFAGHWQGFINQIIVFIGPYFGILARFLKKVFRK